MSSIPNPTETALPRFPAGWHLVATAVLADGSLALVAADIDIAHEWRRDSNGRVLGRPAEVAARATAKVWYFDGTALVDGPAFPLETPFANIDRFDDGRWLVVAPRTDTGPNARVLAPDGACLARFMLGDGIEHVGVDRRGEIWVGWFDEGIFGNDEWRVPNEAWPPSSHGIGRFSAAGDHRSPLIFPEGAGMVADCYALNIAGDSVWACPYTAFPLFEMHPDGSIRWWSNEVAGAKALAVSEGRALLAGGMARRPTSSSWLPSTAMATGSPLGLLKRRACRLSDTRRNRGSHPTSPNIIHGTIRRSLPGGTIQSISSRMEPGIDGL